MTIINAFPGYEYIPSGDDKRPHNMYRGEDVGFGGYVYAEPGIYANVALLDIASQHPTSIEVLNLFGPYTAKFKELKDARLAIKRRDYDTARTLLGGKLTPYLVDESQADALSFALKIVINSIYGYTSATFPNTFKDPRNTNNIVALRGALFMVNLKHEVQERGFTVAHIKTDSIKIPNATPEIIEFVTEYGKKYGYDFEHEGTYDKFCLVNDAVYIARTGTKWTAVGAQFQHPYVFKSLFTEEELVFDDFCEARSVVQGRMYLNFSDISNDPPVLSEMVHIGRTGVFVPVTTGGGRLWRIKDDKHYAVAGTKDHLWIEREMAQARGSDLDIDMSYFNKLADEAIKTINKFGSITDLMN